MVQRHAVRNEHVTLTCGCAGTMTLRVLGTPACGVVITSAREGCDEHEAGRRKLISLQSIVARRHGVTRRLLARRPPTHR